MKNNITNWTYEKPTEEGLYLACYGDTETPDNIQPFRLLESNKNLYGKDFCGFPGFNQSEVATWHPSFKFARLCVGSECDE